MKAEDYEVVKGKNCDCCGEEGAHDDPVRDYGRDGISYGPMDTHRYLRDSCKETLDDELGGNDDFGPTHPNETTEEFMDHEDFD